MTTHECTGCGELIETKDDLRKEQGTVSPSWRCGVCGTKVPSVVGERIKHQD